MVGLTNPRQRARHHSYDFAVDKLPSSRSPSPHATLHRRPRLRGHRSGILVVGNHKSSKWPLLGPPLIFLGLLWIGLQAGGPDNKLPMAVVVDPEEMMRRELPNGGRLRGNAIDTKDTPVVPNNGVNKQNGDMGDGEHDRPGIPPNDNQEADTPNVEDDPEEVPPPPLENPEDTEPNVEPTQAKPQKEVAPVTAAKEPVGAGQATLPKSQTPPPPTEKIVSLFLEPRGSLDEATRPLPPRKTSAAILESMEYPEIKSCADIPRRLPVNHLPDRDPFLPWIHDYFVSPDGHSVQFIAANKRRCETGQGKESVMAYLQAQVSLFQHLPVARIRADAKANNTLPTTRYRLASPDDPDVVAAETRFQCRFHRNPGEEWITFSRFDFNYEYVIWRKRGAKPMFVETGPDVDQAELSQLMFSCPIPEELRIQHESGSPSFWVDVIPIRTPPRKNSVLLTANHTGPKYSSKIHAFDAGKSYGTEHVLPLPTDSGRWANLPVCMHEASLSQRKPHTLTACTWASARYRRRGDDSFFYTDTLARLREWVHFHRLVGVDHIYVYDNTHLPNATAVSPLEHLVEREFADYVTYIPWPAQVCNNRKSKDNVPGERSSQYAAEGSCLKRFGGETEWMTFLDVDEYLVPTGSEDWKNILGEHTKKDDSILSLRSARGRPRLDLLQELKDTTVCEATKRHLRKRAEDACLEVRANETFLKAYNCDTYPPPRPDSFVKSKKQIVRPSFVLQHFVNNSTVTMPLATYYQDTILSGGKSAAETFTRESAIPEVFINEVSEGFLLHAKTVPPPETMLRSHTCQSGSGAPCTMGYVCPASTARNETLQRKNGLRDDAGKFCNCWVHPHVETRWIPRLEQALSASPR